MFVFAIATIALDLIALQCGPQNTCWNAKWWLEPLGNRPAPERLLLGALIPLGALVLIHQAGGPSVPFLEGYTPGDRLSGWLNRPIAFGEGPE